jgi:hypothetical protein
VWEPGTGGLAIMRSRCKSAFLRPVIEDRLTVAGAAGCAEVQTVDPAAIVPSDRGAMAAWLDRLTSAQIDEGDQPVTP